MKSARGRWRALTKSTETTPTEFQVGDEVTFWIDDFAPWQGGKGIVREARKANYGTHGMDYKVEVTEAPPKNSAVKAGHQTWFEEDWLKLVERVRLAKADAVNHPPHYGGEDNPYEVIKVAEAWGLDKDAYLFNVLKYIARAGKKGSRLEDLKKGSFYINRRINLEENAK